MFCNGFPFYRYCWKKKCQQQKIFQCEYMNRQAELCIEQSIQLS